MSSTNDQSSKPKLWNRMIGKAQTGFRIERAERILAKYPDIVGSTVVDIGGSLPFWQTVETILKPAKVIIYNISDSSIAMGLQNVSGVVETHVYDGKRVPMDDGSADFLMCNSVIEHVAPELRQGLADEIKRVGKRHIVQTPSPGFPLELHFGLPFLHWLPRPLARQIVPISPFALFSDTNAKAYFDQTRLLRKAELQAFFPQSEIEIERAYGFPKSMIAFG